MTSEKNRFFKLYKTSKAGGLPQKLPVPYGEYGAISPDGKTLAYLPYARDHRTWKRYRGGLTSEIWLFDLERGDTWSNLTEDVGLTPPRGDQANDSQPMWHGDSLYFVSDRDEAKRWNIWVHSDDNRRNAGRSLTSPSTTSISRRSGRPRSCSSTPDGCSCSTSASEETREVEIDVVTDRAYPAAADREGGRADRRATTSRPRASGRCSRPAARFSPCPLSTASPATSPVPRASPSATRRGVRRRR